MGNYTTFGGKGIRSYGNYQFLGRSAIATDIATLVITFANFGIDPTHYELIKVRMRNVGSTSSSANNMRFYFNGTRYDGAAYRYVGNRAIFDGTTNTDTNQSGWNQTAGRVGYGHDSTAHDSWTTIWIPNVGKNSYVENSGTAYQTWWSESRGVDGSSRPQVYLHSGFVNSATSRNIVTGLWIDSSSGNYRNTEFEIFGLPLEGVGGIE